VQLILTALQKASLYCNLEKTKLFQKEVSCLGHVINVNGISPDNKKIKNILNWPTPSSAKDVRGFLGLVQWLAAFLPQLVQYMQVLTKLTEKDCNHEFPPWTVAHQAAFDSIKNLVLSTDCLTVIDHELMTDRFCIFITTDTSDTHSGGMLSFRKTWEDSCPVAFDSKAFHKVEVNYPVHEKELFEMV
jgi:hypothetical protein